MDEDKLQLELKKMQDEIISAVEAMISKSNKDLERYINDTNKIRFEHIEETLKRYHDNHKDHYDVEKELESKINNIPSKITESRESIIKDVDTKINTNNNSSKNNIGIFISAIAVITSIILSIVLNM